MRALTTFAALVCAALVIPTAATATPAGWDAAPLPVASSGTDYLGFGPVAETAADGAIWVAWAETPPSRPTQIVVRRVSPEGQVGPMRILTTSSPGSFNGGVALSRVGATDMRVVYLSEAGDRIELRRLTPLTTGAAEAVYDKTTTVDADGAGNNGAASNAPLQLLAAPGGAAWILYRRLNNTFTPVVEARRVASDDTLGPAAEVASNRYEAAGAVNPQDGGLVSVVTGGSQGQTVAVPVSSGATVGGSVVLRDPNPPLNPPSSPFAGTVAPAIGIGDDGIATTGWQSDVQGSPRLVQVRRLDANTVTALGAGPQTLGDGLPQDYIQYGPLLAVDPAGGAVAGWFETTSNGATNNAIVRGLGPGALSDVGVIGPRHQLDETGRAAAVADLIPGTGGIVTVLEYGADLNSQAAGCRVASVDATTGLLVGVPEQLAPGNCYPQGPSDAAYGLFAIWGDSAGMAQLVRRVDDAPVCSDGGPVSVTAGTSVALPLGCAGWRPTREITGTPVGGTLGVVDDVAGTVTYTAGGTPGSDSVRFRASNGAGTSAEATVPVTLTAAPLGPVTPVTPVGGGGGGGGAGPGGAGAPAADRTAPVISRVSLSPRRVRRAPPRTLSLRFRLSEAATVTVTVERLVPGRRIGDRGCVPARRSMPRRSRCQAAVRVSRVSRRAGAGATSVALTIGRGKAAPVAGSYRVTVTARDDAGNTGAASRATLSVVAR